MKKLVILLVLSAVSGCASIVSDSRYPVQVNSAPVGVSFEVKNEDNRVVASGVTPTNIMLKSGAGYFNGEEYTFTFTSECNSTRQQILDSELDGWYFGNIIFGGLIGLFVVDPLTGAMFKLPENVNENLLKSCVAEVSNEEEISKTL